MDMNQVAALGRSTLEKWKAVGYETDALAEIARQELEASRAGLGYRLDGIARWLATTGELPEQFAFDSPFGEPPLTLFMDPERRLAVEIYHWLHTDTSLHDHGFAGACLLLQGKSLHLVRRFEASPAAVGRDLVTGDVGPAQAKLLREGDVFPILSGSRFIHEVCHLSEPTVSLVVRSVRDVGVTQRDYFPPHYSLPPAAPALQRRSLSRRFTATLRACDPSLAETFEREVADAEDATTAFLGLKDRLAGDDARISLAAIDAVQARFPAELPGLRAVAVRLASHTRLVFEAVGEEARLFAALLFNFGLGQTTDRLLRELRPDEAPSDVAVRSLREILAARPLNPRLVEHALALMENGAAATAGPLSAMDKEIAALWRLPTSPPIPRTPG